MSALELKQLIPLYMHGLEVHVSQDTVIHMAPAGTPDDKLLTVRVEGIRFLISRDMVLQADRPDCDRVLPMADNYFALALRNHDDKKEIEIDDRRDGISQAKFFPVVFDYLRRRLSRQSAPLCTYDMKSDDAMALHALLDILFVTTRDDKLPSNLNRVYVVTMPDAGPGDHHDMHAGMCMDPTFVRLVREIKDPNRSKSDESKERRKNTFNRLILKHGIETISWSNLRHCTVHTLTRGERFTIETTESDADDDRQSMSVVRSRDDLHCA